MKLNWILGAVFATALTIPASAQLSIYVRTGPPANRYEQRGDSPGPGYTWIDGYWTPQGNRYQWTAGRWQQPPFEGAYWSHPHYDHERQGWRLHEGHWDREDHRNRDDRDDHDRGRDRDRDRDHKR